MQQIGITERGDAALDPTWKRWVKDGKPAILISKDPEKLLQELKGLPNLNVIVHATITGYGSHRLEPNVPHPTLALSGYYELIQFLGSERVVLRVDPIIPTPVGIISAAKPIISKAKGRVRISFLDNYLHVQKRWAEAHLPPLPYKMHANLSTRQEYYKQLNALVKEEIEICGEPGMKCTGCISERDIKTFGLEGEIPSGSSYQRKACKCLLLKKELLSRKGRCQHNCVYCYWK